MINGLFFQRIVDQFIEKHNSKSTYGCINNITVCGDHQQDHDAKPKSLFSAARIDGFTFNKSKCVFACTKIDLLKLFIIKFNITPNVYNPYLNCLYLAVKPSFKELCCHQPLHTHITPSEIHNVRGQIKQCRTQPSYCYAPTTN